MGNVQMDAGAKPAAESMVTPTGLPTPLITSKLPAPLQQRVQPITFSTADPSAAMGLAGNGASGLPIITSSSQLPLPEGFNLPFQIPSRNK